MPTRRQHLRELARIRRGEIARRSRQMPDQEASQGSRNGPTHTPDQSPPHSPRRSPSRSPPHSPRRSPTRSPPHSPRRSPSRSPPHSPRRSPPHSPRRSLTRSPTRSPSRSPSPQPGNHKGRAPIGGKTIKSSRARKSLLGRKLKPKKSIKKPKIPIFKHKPRRILPSGKRVRDLKLLSREIKFYTSTWANLIPRAPFARLVRQVAQSIKNDLRFQSSAIEALQEAAEMMLAIRFDILQDMARHAHRTTIMGRDAGLLQRTLKKAVGIDDIGLAPTSEGFRGYKA